MKLIIFWNRIRKQKFVQGKKKCEYPIVHTQELRDREEGTYFKD